MLRNLPLPEGSSFIWLDLVDPTEAEMAEVAAAVGQMTPSAMSRARSALSRRETPRPIDVNQLLAELEDLILPEEATAAHG